MKWKILPWALAALFLWGVVAENRGARRQAAGEWKVLEQMRAEREILKAKLAEAETRVVLHTDTVRLYATRYRTLRDSLVITDTVRVKEALAVADTTIRACVDLANDCEQYKHDSKELIWSQQKQIEWWERQYHPFCGRKCGVVMGLGAGLAAALYLNETRRALRP